MTEPKEARVSSNPLSDSMVPLTMKLGADMLDDIERVRIANENRLRQLVRVGFDKDGGERGLEMLPPGITVGEEDKVVDLVLGAARTHLEAEQKRIALGHGVRWVKPPAGWNFFVWQICIILIPMVKANEDATKNLQKMIQEHPLHPWISGQKGLGDKQTGRLLAVIGDPYWNDLHDRPRLVSELWSYCGFAVTDAGLAPSRTRGLKINWSMDARMRCRMIAESCLKSGGPYRAVYDRTKEFYAEAVHKLPCPRCGPAGSPAKPGSPLSKNHAHSRALRAISKQVLRDLWIESRRLHEAAAKQREAAA